MFLMPRHADFVPIAQLAAASLGKLNENGSGDGKHCQDDLQVKLNFHQNFVNRRFQVNVLEVRD